MYNYVNALIKRFKFIYTVSRLHSRKLGLAKMAQSSGDGKYKIIDIGANLTDPMYRGNYHGSQKHSDDLDHVLQRAFNVGVEKIIVTGGCLADCREALLLVQKYEQLTTTVGCHPTRCNEFEDGEKTPENYLKHLQELIQQNRDKVVAVGECGLDYERLNFCSKETQKKYFELQISLAEESKLPMFLHCRNSTADLVEILKRNRDNFKNGVVHSFDGSKDEAQAILDLDLYIGINGCSLKSQDNLEVASSIPLDRLMIETDCPWCEVKPSHAGFKYIKTKFPSLKKEKWAESFQVKGRNEPENIIHILEILSAVRNEDIDSIANACYRNTKQIFFPSC